MPNPSRTVLVYAALTASVFFWGAGFAVARYALAAVSPLQLLVTQLLMAVAVEFIWILASGRLRHLSLPKGAFWGVLLTGITNQSLLNGVTYFGLHLTTATNAALIYGISPTLIAVFAAIFLGEPFGRRKQIGAVVGFVGVALIITQGRLSSLQFHGAMAGNLLVLAAATYWAAYAIIARFSAQKVKPEVYTFYILVLGAVGPTAWLAANGGLGFIWHLHWRVALAAAWMGIGTGVLGMNFWNWGLSRVEASRVGVFSYLEPVFAASVAIVFLNEIPTWITLLGAVIVLSGIFVSAGDAA